MMVKASPAATFEMIEANFLLELFVVALDAPAELGQPYELLARHISRQRGQP